MSTVGYLLFAKTTDGPDRWHPACGSHIASANNGGRMAATGVAQHSLSHVRDSVPDGEIEVIVRLGEVNRIQSAKHRARILPISVCESACA